MGLRSFPGKELTKFFARTGDNRYTVRVGDSTVSTAPTSVTGETVSFKAGAAGTTGFVTLAYAPVYNADHGLLGSNGDTSFSWVTGTILDNEVAFQDHVADATQLALMSQGDYAIDYDTGRIRYCKKTNGTSDTCGYYTRRLVVGVELADYTDNSAEFTVDASKGLAMMGIYSSSAVTAGRVAVPRINSKRNLVVTSEQQVGAVTSATLDLTDVAAANRRFDTTFTKPWKVSAIYIVFSTAQARDIAISHNDGTNLFTLSSDAGDTSLTYIFPPNFEYFGTATDEIRVQFSQAGGACTADVRIVYEER